MVNEPITNDQDSVLFPNNHTQDLIILAKNEEREENERRDEVDQIEERNDPIVLIMRMIKK